MAINYPTEQELEKMYQDFLKKTRATKGGK